LQDLPRKATMTKVKRNGVGGAFQPFNKEKSVGKKTIVLGRLGEGVRIEGFFFFFYLLLNVKE